MSESWQPPSSPSPSPDQPGPEAPTGWPAPQSAGPPEVAPPGPPAPVGPHGPVWFDRESQLWLPQGTQLASVGRRIGAYFLAFPLVIVTLVIGYVIWGAIVWGRGQTPALQVLGMRVYRPDTGRVAGWWWMALREVVGRLVESVLSVITQLISFVLFLTTKERRTLHDLVAGTVVLRDEQGVLAPR